MEEETEELSAGAVFPWKREFKLATTAYCALVRLLMMNTQSVPYMSN